MNVLDLFSGIGGISLGLTAAGMHTRQFVECDPNCQAWLAHHWPEVPIHGDIHTFDPAALVRQTGFIDLVAGGFPCQPVSQAGLGRGEEDERWLWPEMCRIISAIRPNWVLAENVPGLRTKGADTVFADLEALGYTCWPSVVGAAAIGHRHRRNRVWIIACRTGAGEGGGDLGGRLGPGGHAGAADAGASARPTGSELGYAYGDGHQERALPDVQWETLPQATGPVPYILDDATCERLALGQSLRCYSGEELSAALRTGVVAGPGTFQYPWEHQRLVEPGLGWPADGVSRRVATAHRIASLHGLGNAVVPQIVEAIGRAILKTEQHLQGDQ